MTEEKKNNLGKIGWTDLTVRDAESVRDFYRVVVGWQHQELSMGDYADFVMTPSGSDVPVAGICHARGGNAGIPPYWMVYIYVENIEQSVESCIQLGGELVSPIRKQGDSAKYCVIKDPAGAVCALYQEL